MPWPVCSALRGGRLDSRSLTRRASKPARGGWRPSILGRRPQRGLDGSLLVGGVRRARNAPAPVRAKHSYRYGLITPCKDLTAICLRELGRLGSLPNGSPWSCSASVYTTPLGRIWPPW